MAKKSTSRRSNSKAKLIDLPFQATNRPPAIPAKQTKRGIDLPFASQLMMGAGAHRNDCGPACVRMALDFLGLAPNVSIDQMAIEADADDDGTTPQDLVRLAAAHSAQATIHTLPQGVLPNAPAILLVRYPGFKREHVENQTYWDGALVNPKWWHWLWWLGNAEIDGQLMSVWNDPLYIAGSGKNVLRTVDELNAAFLPYGNACIAITFEGIANPLPKDEGTLTVVTIEDGVRLRSVPSTQSADSILATLPLNQSLTVLESATGARIKMSGGNAWLRVRTTVNGSVQEGYIAAWYVREAGASAAPMSSVPGLPYTWQDVINASYIACSRTQADWNNTLEISGFWRSFVDGLRPVPYTGPAIDQWPVSPELRQQMLDLLKLNSDALLQQTLQTANELEAKAQTTAAERQPLIGIHGPPGIGCPPRSEWGRWIKTLQSMGVRWYKQCDNGDLNQNDILDWAKRLKQAGIEPIIRYLVDRQFPNPMPDHYFEKMKRYAEADIRWAEIGNEPNLGYEWQQAWETRVNFNTPEIIRLLCEGWVNDAQRAIAAGVRPALYAMGPTDWKDQTNSTLSSVYFYSRMALYLADQRRAETLDLFRKGAWFAVHSATFEQPDDFEPFRAGGAIWDQCLRGYEIVRKCFRDAFGGELDVDAIPIASTEGGVFTPESTSMGGHTPLRSDEEHAQRIVGMFQFLEQRSPLMAMCPWCISAEGFGGPFDARFNGDGWFKTMGGILSPRAVVAALQQLQTQREAATTAKAATRGLRAIAPMRKAKSAPAAPPSELIKLGIAMPQKVAAPRKAKRGANKKSKLTKAKTTKRTPKK